MRPARRFPALPARCALLALALLACAPPRAETGPALWRLSDADSEIWLFGTVHMLPPDLEWRSPRLDAALKDADVVYFETATDAAAASEIARLVGVLGRNPPGERLSDQLSPDDQARLKRVAQQLNLNPENLETARPWLAALQLSVAFITAQGQAADSGVESVLGAQARAQGKRLAYFETAEEQMRFFADLPVAVQAGFLSATLREIEEGENLTEEVDRAWARGDLKRLAADLNSMLMEAGPEVYEALIRSRNERWAAEIDTMMQGSGSAFIAVGAAHLVGDDSVAELLREKGYRVEGP